MRIRRRSARVARQYSAVTSLLQLRERLNALSPAAGAELVRVLMLPDFDRAGRIGEFYGHPESRTFAELVIDLEEDRVARALVVGMLKEAKRADRSP